MSAIPLGIKSNDSKICTNKNEARVNSIEKEIKVEDLKTMTRENHMNVNNQNRIENIISAQNAKNEEILGSNEASGTLEDISKSECATVKQILGDISEISGGISAQSETKPNETEAAKQAKEINGSEISTETPRNDVPKSGVITETATKKMLIEDIEILPTISTTQNIPENLTEQSVVDTLKRQTDSTNCASETETITPVETAKFEPTKEDQKTNISAPEKYAAIGQIPGPSQIHNTEDKSVKTIEAETKTCPKLESLSEINSINNKTSALPDNLERSPSASETTKSGKLKSTKVSKIKKSLDRDKNEVKDKLEVAESSPFSESQHSGIATEKDNKISSDSDNSLKREVIETTDKPHEKEKLEENSSSEIAKKLEAISQTEYKTDTNEKKTAEEPKLQTSSDASKSVISENALQSPDEPTQNTKSSIQLQSDISVTDVAISPLSKTEQNSIQEISTTSEKEQTVMSSNESIQNSSKSDNDITSTEAELQKSDGSNERQKNHVTTEAASSQNNASNNTVKNSASSESAQEDFKIMPPVSSTTFPNKSKKLEASSSTIVPVELATTQSTEVIHNSKVAEISISINVSDSSQKVAAALCNSSQTAVLALSNSCQAAAETFSNSSQTAAVALSNNSQTAAAAVSNNSQTDLSAKASAILLMPSSSIDRDAAEPSTTATGTASSNSSNTITTASSSAVALDNSNKVSSTVSKVSDTKLSTVQEQVEPHSKVADTTIADTSLNNKVSSPADTASKSESTPLRQTVSEDNNTTQDADSDIDDSDESRPSSVTPPSPVDALRSRFEGLAGGTVRGAPGRPASPFRRMSFNSRKQVIALEKKRDTSADKPWFHQKIVNEPVKIAQPKRTIKQQLEMERKVRKMVSDRKCRTYRKAEIVVQLMDMNFEEEEAIQAANECATLEQAISYLQQECLLCTGNFPVSQIVSMTHCEHRACRDCIRAYFTVQIRDRTILDLLCPFCNEPDIADEDVAQDYFNHLDIMLKKLVDFEIHELFQRKLRDRVLMKDPNFRWCSQCSSGFISEPNLKRLICPDCNAVTCASCRRLWERDHQGITCEAFAALKDASDPEAQAAGLAKMLTEDGIDCPRCHFRYALAKGGCMHFRCIQCQHDFCSGCSRPFKMGQKCGVSEFCAKLGLHAHHPRNCLFYLRDKEPEDLQKLLDMNDVKYNREPPEGMELRSTCQVMEQKETSDGMVDDFCGKEIQDGFAGLCRVHYVEYLGQLVNKHKVDPIQIFDNDDLELVLRRANIRLPPKRYRESDAQYREKLVNLIQEELPLDKMDGS